MHRQASFYQANWPEGTEVAEDGDVFAFPLPPIDGRRRPGARRWRVHRRVQRQPGHPGAARPTSPRPDWANVKAEVSGPRLGQRQHGPGRRRTSTSPIDQLAAELFQDPDAVFRFDGSDLMPGEVGAGAVWTELTNWIANDKPTQQVLTDVENAWPAS